MRTLYIIARMIIGSVFIFSGFVKGIDPLGSTYKFQDYFAAFGMDFLSFMAFPLAIVLSAAEFLVGLSVMTGWRHRTGAWSALLFIGFFTLLTFYLALTNPVTDCGCFGDAIILTNWQTFFKNLVLLVPIVFVFAARGRYGTGREGFTEWSLLAGFGILFLVLETYNYRHLPILDFRPYREGTWIPAGMTVPDGAPQDEYRTYLTYEKDGVTKEFNEDNFPWQDTTWTYVSSRSELVSKGYEPPIHDFNIVTRDGEDITDRILDDKGYSFLLVSHDLSKVNPGVLARINELAVSCLSEECSFYCLTSSVQDDIDRIIREVDPVFDFYLCDEITLKTIIRSNPGLLLLKDGVILAKWHVNDFPGPLESGRHLMAGVIDRNRDVKEMCSVLFILAVFAGLLTAVAHFVPRTSRKN